MNKSNVVTMIRARVERASPDRTQYKPYATDLVFDDPAVYVEVPVPAEHITKEKDGSLTLSLAGWTIFLDVYATSVENMHQQYLKSYNMTGQHRPYQIK